MAHWHDFNPWAQHCVYISYEEMRELLADKPFYSDERLAQHGSRLDAYILPQPSESFTRYSFGLRFGREGADYLSIPITNIQGDALMEKRGLR